MIHQKITCSGAIHKLIKVSYVYLLDLVCILYRKNEIIHFLCFNPKSLKSFQYEQSEPCNQKNILFV